MIRPRSMGMSGGSVVRSPADLAAKTARHLSPVDTLKYLAREWEDYGVIDAVNMRHVYWALEESAHAPAPESTPSARQDQF